MRKLCVVLAVVAGVMLLVNGAYAAPPVKLGFNDVRSGPFKTNGDMGLLGLEVAIKEINKSGGLLGRQIELVVEDNQMNPEIAVQKLKKLILEEKVEAVFHESSSSVALAIAQTIPRYKKLYICTGAGTMGPTTENFNPYVFRTTGNVVMYLKGHAAYFAKEKYRKVYLINFDNALGHDVAKYYEKFIKEVAPDVQIVGNEFHPVFTKDFAPYISKIKASGADYIFTCDWGTDLIQLVKQARSLGVTAPVAGIFLADANGLPVMGDSAIGSVAATFMLLGLNNPKAKQFEDAFYKESGGTYPIEQIYQTYSAMMMYAAAVKKAGSFDTQKVTKAWEGLEWDGPYGKVLMRAQDHQAMLPLYVGKVMGKTKYFDYPYFTYIMTVPREQVEYKPEDYGWKPYKER